MVLIKNRTRINAQPRVIFFRLSRLNLMGTRYVKKSQCFLLGTDPEFVDPTVTMAYYLLTMNFIRNAMDFFE